MSFEQININLFYPLLFFTFIFFAVLFTVIWVKNKDTNIFFKHSDEHIDTTGKMKDMHDTTAKINFTVAHERELHNLEKMAQEINNKLDLLTQRVIELENNRHQQ